MNNLLSILTGLLIAVMITFNGALSSKFGNYNATLFIHFIGFVAICIFMFVKKIKFKLNKNIPFYLYTAGALGVFTVFFNNYGFSVLGVSIPLAISLLSQSIASIMVDHFGLLGMQVIKFNKKKCVGLSLILIGIITMLLF